MRNVDFPAIQNGFDTQRPQRVLVQTLQQVEQCLPCGEGGNAQCVTEDLRLIVERRGLRYRNGHSSLDTPGSPGVTSLLTRSRMASIPI